MIAGCEGIGHDSMLVTIIMKMKVTEERSRTDG
jgi:hypothetical protein